MQEVINNLELLGMMLASIALFLVICVPIMKGQDASRVGRRNPDDTRYPCSCKWDPYLGGPELRSQASCPVHAWVQQA